MTDYQLIDKEIIADLAFPGNDVLNKPDEIRELSAKIHRATSLGNIENTKVMILFIDKERYKKVFTTIWAQTKKKIVLKKGLFIPVNRIVDIRFS